MIQCSLRGQRTIDREPHAEDKRSARGAPSPSATPCVRWYTTELRSSLEAFELYMQQKHRNQPLIRYRVHLFYWSALQRCTACSTRLHMRGLHVHSWNDAGWSPLHSSSFTSSFSGLLYSFSSARNCCRVVSEHSAGVDTVAMYSHFSGSETSRSCVTEPQTWCTVRLRAGPCQHPWPCAQHQKCDNVHAA